LGDGLGAQKNMCEKTVVVLIGLVSAPPPPCRPRLMNESNFFFKNPFSFFVCPKYEICPPWGCRFFFSPPPLRPPTPGEKITSVGGNRFYPVGIKFFAWPRNLGKNGRAPFAGANFFFSHLAKRNHPRFNFWKGAKRLKGVFFQPKGLFLGPPCRPPPLWPDKKFLGPPAGPKPPIPGAPPYGFFRPPRGAHKESKPPLLFFLLFCFFPNNKTPPLGV